MHLEALRGVHDCFTTELHRIARLIRGGAPIRLAERVLVLRPARVILTDKLIDRLSLDLVQAEAQLLLVGDKFLVPWSAQPHLLFTCMRCTHLDVVSSIV